MTPIADTDLHIDFRTTLAPENRSPRLAREFVRDSLQGLVATPVVDDMLLLVSEIVTNVVRHARTDAELRLSVGARCVQLSCRDCSDAQLERRYPGPHDETGRGLYLIDTIASAWGVDRVAGGGKVVWVRVDRPSADGRAELA